MKVEKHDPGIPCWAELGTTSADGAKKFYKSMFGWDAKDMKPVPEMTYTIFQLNGQDVGGLYTLSEQYNPGQPPAWLNYVSVTSADKTANRVKELGGKIILEPMDVPEAGRAALFQDPQGAVFGVWQPGKSIGAQVVNEVGAFCWSELATSDEKSGREFYTKLFDWNTEDMPMDKFNYVIFKSDTRPVAGMFQITKEMQGLPPVWFVYFAVADCDQSVEKAKAEQGKVMVPPTDIPNIGRFAILTDPQGASFAIIKLAAM